MKRKSILYKTLCRALSLKRPHNGEGASLFTGWLCDHVPAHLDLTIDAAGNVHIDNRSNTRHRTLFIAHVDTSPEMPGANVRPIVHAGWDGRDILFPDAPGLVLRPADDPVLAARIGDDIVTASGDTLLGADNASSDRVFQTKG